MRELFRKLKRRDVHRMGICRPVTPARPGVGAASRALTGPGVHAVVGVGDWYLSVAPGPGSEFAGDD
jgi:hypothetical protein